MSAHGRSEALIPKPSKGEGTSVSAHGRSEALIPKPFKGEGAPMSAQGRSEALSPGARSAKSIRVSKRPYDVVLYGASGFVGRQTVAYFAQHGGGLRWALAGRNEGKLKQARAAAGPGAAKAGLIVAEAADAEALGALAAQSKVVASTAGPFALYGSALVAACVAHGTHYCDITGETPWVRGVIDRHHEQAAADSTRIVPCCGFDSVPSDIGALLVADAVKRESGQRCVRIKACHSIRGGLNGGTLASLLNIAEAGALDQLADLFLLNPEGSAPADRSAHADPLAPRHDGDLDAWLAPFVMAAINTRIVRRSVALAGARSAYAPGMVYQEFLRTGRGPLGAALAAGMAGGIGVGIVGMRSGAWRVAMRKLLPAPGQGPSERAMDNGSFRCELIGESENGTQVHGCIAGRGDPGNRATTLFVCEAAMALAGDVRKLPGGASRGGVLTPATALGLPYARRLAAAGITALPLPA
jgi:short subunit dehydrogenase-like uncharacterized protein